MNSVCVCIPNREYSDEIMSLLKSINASEGFFSRTYRFFTAGDLSLALDVDKLALDLIILFVSHDDDFGISFAEDLSSRFRDTGFIFISDTYDFLTNAFLLGVRNYFAMPIDFTQFRKALYAVITNQNPEETFIIKNRNVYKKVKYTDIVFAESFKRNTALTTTCGVFDLSFNMDRMENMLSSHNFIRCHKSYIINIDYIDYIKNNILFTTTGANIPLGRTYKNTLLSVYNK